MRTSSPIVLIALAFVAIGNGATAQIETATARGGGKVMGTHCDPSLKVCQISSSGTEYHCDFSGQLAPKKGVFGTVVIHDSDLGVRVKSIQVVGFVDPNTNSVQWTGTCEFVSNQNPALPKLADCNGFAQDLG